MPLTPGDVHNVTFSKPPIGKRGYNEDEVDAFLDLVSTELARLINENNDLHSRIDQLNQQLRARSAVPPAPRQAPPTVDQHAQSAKVLGMAQEIADRLTSEAKTEADRMLSTVKTTTQQLFAEAQAKADSTLSEARSRAQTMLEEARTRADTLDRQSQEKATALEREAARKRTEILGGISQEKIALENSIDELRAFEREYRTRLKIYLSAQLRELDNRATNTSADISRSGYNIPQQPQEPAAERLRDVDPYIVAS